MSLAKMNVGIIGRKRSTFGSSMEAYLAALEYARLARYEPLVATILQNMGSLANSMEKHDLALNYLRESLDIHTRTKNERGMAGAMANMGISLKLMGKTDSAVRYYDLAAQKFKQLNDNVNQAKMNSNIGQLYMAEGNYTKALRFLNLAIDMMEEQKNYNDLVNTLNAKAELHFKLEQFKTAINIANRAIKLAEQQGYLMGAKNAYDHLAKAQAENDAHDDALESLRKVQALNDSMRSKEQAELVAEMEVRYKSEKKDLQIKQQLNQLALQDLRIRDTYIIGALLCLLVLFLSFTYFRIRKLNAQLRHHHKNLEEKNEELAQLSAFKDRLLTVVSHDVRNPLTGIKSMLGLQASGAINVEEFTEWNVDMTKRIDSALGMLTNLLEWSKLQYVGLKPYPEKLDLNLFLREVVEQVQYQAALKSVYIKWEVAPGATVLADRHMLRICIYNLLSNAIKFSHKGSSVWLMGRQKDKEVVLEVIDLGVGMDAEAKLKVLQPRLSFTTYGTENEKGSGVGLMLVHELLELMGARLEVESEPGEGSVFRIYLPE
jgi:signal transduction histidine kinase